MRASRLFRSAFLMLLFFALIPYALPQQGDQQGSGTPTTPSKPPPKKPQPPPYIPPEPESGNIRKPPPVLPPSYNLFISGTVVSEDGSPPPFGATIEMDCGSSLTRQAAVGNDGYFSFQVAGNKNYGLLMPDASAGYGRDPYQPGVTYDTSTVSSDRFSPRITQEQLAAKMLGCDLRAQLPGYQSSRIRVVEVLQPGQNDLGTIVVYPLERIQGTTVSVASLLAPKEAKKSLERAQKALKKKRFEKAEVFLKSAVQEYPQYGDAWCELGQLYKHQHRDEEARHAYVKAMESDKLYVQPYIGLSWLSSIERKWQEAADFSGQALNLDPVTFPEAYFLNALANLNLENLDIAEKSARQYQRLDPECRYPRVFLILSNVYSMKNDNVRSIEALRNYLKHAPDAPDADAIRSRLKKKLAKAEAD